MWERPKVPGSALLDQEVSVFGLPTLQNGARHGMGSEWSGAQGREGVDLLFCFWAAHCLNLQVQGERIPCALLLPEGGHMLR